MALDLSKLLKKVAEAKVTPPAPFIVPKESKPEGIIESLNNIDAIIDGAKAEEIVHTVNEPDPPYAAHLICTCGHPLDAHDDGQECDILECECTEFDSAHPEEAPQAVLVEDARPQLVVTIPPTDPVAEVIQEQVKQGLSLPAPTPDGMPDNYCAHLCECGNWWTHGLENKCRFPDLLKQGKCQSCLSVGEESYNPLEGFESVDGKERLTPAAQVKVRQDESLVCKAMNVEQLTFHIEFIAKRIEELRVRAIQARKMRADQEEELTKDLPEEEREKFRQELRQGAKKSAPRAKKVKADDASSGSGGERLSKMEKTIRSLMKSLGKSRAQVEAMLND